jgi:hypothetical protein
MTIPADHKAEETRLDMPHACVCPDDQPVATITWTNLMVVSMHVESLPV